MIKKRKRRTIPVTFFDKELAPAKINLDLYVTGKREDGFHEIVSLMASLDLADTVRLSAAPSDSLTVVTTTENADLPENENNLATRAALLFCRRRRITADIRITVEKHIPIGAGLAGGSADAAAVLRLCNRAFPNRYREDELSDLASEIGSDVNFCLHNGVCRCLGRGERLTPIPLSVSVPVLLIRPSFSVSTPAAFRLLDLKYGSFATESEKARLNAPKMNAALEKGKLHEIAALTYNTFEEVTDGVSPLIQKLLSLGALSARMSGSGPTVYGIFESAEAAEAAMSYFGDRAVVSRIERSI